MPKFPSKIQVTTAMNPISSKRFEEDHVTTMSFMRPQPISTIEVMPSRGLRCNAESFCRLNPMPVPTYGRATVYNRAFWVPARTIMSEFNSFISGSPSSNEAGIGVLISRSHTVDNDLFIKLLVDPLYSSEVANPTGDIAHGTANYDFYTYDATDNPAGHGYKLNNEGIFVYKVIESLGYKINFNYADKTPKSAMPLLAYAKVLLDWYFPSSYAWSSIFQELDYIFQYRGTFQLTLNTLKSIFAISYASYQDSYFTSAWDKPLAPNVTTLEPSVALADNTNNSVRQSIVTNDGSAQSGTYYPQNGTPFVGQNSAGNVNQGLITQYVMDALKSLTDYTKRHQLAGVRAVDRYLAEYGYNLSAEIMKRSNYLGYQSFNIQFGDVMSTADTIATGSRDGDVLGSYAGKGVGYGSDVFSLDTQQEFGYFIIMQTLVPHVMYYQGEDRMVNHINLLDYYHGDFDNLGVQAISAREVFMSQDGSLAVSTTQVNDRVFAFIPRYAEYKVGHDKVTGLFRCNSQNAGLSAYYLGRDLSRYMLGTLADVVHDFNFVIGTDAAQYNRLFYSSDLNEQITCINHFEYEVTDSSKSLFDTYDFTDHGHKKVGMNINGSKVE